MNKLIQELAKQAGYTKDMFGVGHWDMPECKKFAELIVQECVDITDDLVHRNADGTWSSNELYTDYNGALFAVKKRIQETFGQ
jgi:hypothetical protein